MATITPVDVGAAPNDGNGDPLRTAFIKLNGNDTNLNAETTANTTQVGTNTTDIGTNATAISDHISDPTAAHAASAVGFAPVGTIAATDTQAAVEEVATDAAADNTATAAGAPLISSEDELAGQMQIAVVATLPGLPDASTIYLVTT